MALQLTSKQVWEEIEKELFAVIGMVTAANEARTVGIVYAVRHRKLYIGSGKETWKVRHIKANPHVSITIPIPLFSPSPAESGLHLSGRLHGFEPL